CGRVNSINPLHTVTTSPTTSKKPGSRSPKTLSNTRWSRPKNRIGMGKCISAKSRWTWNDSLRVCSNRSRSTWGNERVLRHLSGLSELTTRWPWRPSSTMS
ncbi:hypothetical protein LTR11_012093, partial [Exophiala xenobiotica]